MATRRPLTYVSGRITELPSGDSVGGVSAFIYAYQQNSTAFQLWSHVSGLTDIEVLLADGVSTLNVAVNYNG